MKFTLEKQYMLSVLHSQYHACWSSGDFRSQGIRRQDINPQIQNILFPASEELEPMSHLITIKYHRDKTWYLMDTFNQQIIFGKIKHFGQFFNYLIDLFPNYMVPSFFS